MIKPRDQVVKFIHKQMAYQTPSIKNKGKQHHYGYVELRDLLDYIYGEEPTRESAKLNNMSPFKYD